MHEWTIESCIMRIVQEMIYGRAMLLDMTLHAIE